MKTVYEVKVNVTGNEDGTKDVVVSYRKQSKEGEPEQDYQALESGTVFTTEFTNTYKPAETTAVFTAEKKVEGPTIADDTFTFELYKDEVEGTGAGYEDDHRKRNRRFCRADLRGSRTVHLLGDR